MAPRPTVGLGVGPAPVAQLVAPAWEAQVREELVGTVVVVAVAVAAAADGGGGDG